MANLEDIFSPSVVANMDDETLSELASEDEEIKNERKMLQERMKSLKEGARIVSKQARVAGAPSAGR